MKNINYGHLRQWYTLTWHTQDGEKSKSTFIFYKQYLWENHIWMSILVGWRKHLLIYINCPHGSDGKESACNARDPGSTPGSGRSAGEGMSILSSILAWRIPWTQEPGGLQSIGSQRVRHNWGNNTHPLELSKEQDNPSLWHFIFCWQSL